MKKVLLMGLVSGMMSTLYAENVNVKYPQGYKEWKHIKTMIIKPEHSLADVFHGIHHIYANDKAFSGYKTGKFEDGSVIALDFLNYADVNASISETSRIYVATMVKDEQKYKETHGWGYEAFKGNSKKKLVKNVYNMCVKCHEPQEKNNYIFSTLRN